MEDIEYLEEYKDLVLPSISKNATTALRKSTDARARVGRRGVVDDLNSTDDDSSSSAIDMDIFEKLFHGDDNSDNDDKERSQTRQKKKAVKVGIKKPNIRAGPESFSSSDYDSDDSVYNRLLGGKDSTCSKFQKGHHTSRESFDSIDALVRNLGEFIDKPVSSSKTKQNRTTKKSDSPTFTPKALKDIKGRPPIDRKVPFKQNKTKASATKILPQAAIMSTAMQKKLSNAAVKTDKRQTAKPSTIKTLPKSTTAKPARNMPQASTSRASIIRRTILSKKDLGVKKDPEPSVDPLNFDDDTDLISIVNDKADLTTSEDDNDESICYASSDDFSDDSNAEDQTVIDISTDSNFSKTNSELRHTPSPNVSETEDGNIENCNERMKKFLEDTRIYIKRKPAKQHRASDSSLSSLDEKHLRIQPCKRSPKSKAATTSLSKNAKLKAQKNINKTKLEQVNKAEPPVKKKADEKSFTEYEKEQIHVDDEGSFSVHSTSTTTEITKIRNKPKAESTPFTDAVKNKPPAVAATSDALQTTNKNAADIKRRLYDNDMEDFADNITLEQIEQSSLELQKQIMEMNNDLELNMDIETHKTTQSTSNEIRQTKSANNSPHKGKLTMPLSKQSLKESLNKEQPAPRRVGRPRKDSLVQQKAHGSLSKNRAATTDETRPLRRQSKQRTKSCNVPKTSVDSLIREDLRTPTKEAQPKKSAEKITVDKKSQDESVVLKKQTSKQRTQEGIAKTTTKLKLNDAKDVNEDLLKIGDLSNQCLKEGQQNRSDTEVTTVLVDKTADIVSVRGQKESTECSADKISETLEMSVEKETSAVDEKLLKSAKKPKKTKSTSYNESNDTETENELKKTHHAKTPKSKEHVFEKPLNAPSNDSGRKSLSRECSRTPKKEVGALGRHDTDDVSDNSNLSAAEGSDSVGKSQRKGKMARYKSCTSRSSSQESQSSYKSASSSKLEKWTDNLQSGNVSVKHEDKKAQQHRKTAKTAKPNRNESTELSTDESVHKKERKSRKSIKMKMEDVADRSDSAEVILTTPKKKDNKRRAASESSVNSGKSARKGQTLKERKSKVYTPQKGITAKKEAEKSHKKQKKHSKIEDNGSENLFQSDKDTEEKKKTPPVTSKVDSKVVCATGSEIIKEISQRDQQTPKKSTRLDCDKKLESSKSKQEVDTITKKKFRHKRTENASVASNVCKEEESGVADDNQKDDESQITQSATEQMETPTPFNIPENKETPSSSIVTDKISIIDSSATDAERQSNSHNMRKIFQERLGDSSTPARNSPLTRGFKKHLQDELNEMTEQSKAGKGKSQTKKTEPEKSHSPALTLSMETNKDIIAEPNTDEVISDGADIKDEVVSEQNTSMAEVVFEEAFVREEVVEAQSLEDSTVIATNEDVMSNEMMYEPTLSELENAAQSMPTELDADLTSMFADENLMPSDAMIVEQIVEVEFSEISESIHSQNEEVNEETFTDAFSVITAAKPDEASDSHAELNMLQIPEQISEEQIGGNIVELAELLTTQATSLQEEAALDANIKAANELLNQDPKFAEAILAELAENFADARLQVCTDDINDAVDDKLQEVTLQFETVCDIELSNESLAKLTENSLNRTDDAANVAAETYSNELGCNVAVKAELLIAETAVESEMQENVLAAVALENELETNDNITEKETHLVTELQTIPQQLANEAEEQQEKEPDETAEINAQCSSIEKDETSKISLEHQTTTNKPTTRRSKVQAANSLLEHISATKVLYEDEQVEEDIIERSISPWNDVMDVVNADQSIGAIATDTSKQPEQSEVRAAEMPTLSEKTDNAVLVTETCTQSEETAIVAETNPTLTEQPTVTIKQEICTPSDDETEINSPVLTKENEKTVLKIPIEESEEIKIATKTIKKTPAKTPRKSATKVAAKSPKTTKRTRKLLQDTEESKEIASKKSEETEVTVTETATLAKKAKKSTTKTFALSEEASNVKVLKKNKKKAMKMPKIYMKTITKKPKIVKRRAKKVFASKEIDPVSDVDAALDISASSANVADESTVPTVQQQTKVRKKRTKVAAQLDDSPAADDSTEASSSKRKQRAAANIPRATKQTTRTSNRMSLKPRATSVSPTESLFNLSEEDEPSDHLPVQAKITQKTLMLFGLAEMNIATYTEIKEEIVEKCVDDIPDMPAESHVPPKVGRRRGAQGTPQAVTPAEIVVATVTSDQTDGQGDVKAAADVEQEQSVEPSTPKIKTRNSNKKMRKSHGNAKVNKALQQTSMQQDILSNAKDERADAAEESKPLQAAVKEVKTLEQLEAQDIPKHTSEIGVLTETPTTGETPATGTNVAASGLQEQQKPSLMYETSRKLRVRVKKTTAVGKTEAESKKDHDLEPHGKDAAEQMLGNTRRSLRKRVRERSESDASNTEKQTKTDNSDESTENENVPKLKEKRHTAVKEITAAAVEIETVTAELAGEAATATANVNRTDAVAATITDTEAAMQADTSVSAISRVTDVAAVAETVNDAAALTEAVGETRKSVADKLVAATAAIDGIATKAAVEKVTASYNVASSTRRLLRNRLADTQMPGRNDSARRRLAETYKSADIPKTTSIEATSTSQATAVTPVHLTRAQGAATPFKELSALKPQRRSKQLNTLIKDLNNVPDIDKSLSATTKSPALLQKHTPVADLLDANRTKPKPNTPKANAEEHNTQNVATHANSNDEPTVDQMAVDELPPTVLPDKDNVHTISMTSSTETNKTLSDADKIEKRFGDTEIANVSAALQNVEITTQVAITKAQLPAALGVETPAEGQAKQPTVVGIAIAAKSAQAQQALAVSNTTKDKSEPTSTHIEPKNLTRSKAAATTTAATITSKLVAAKVLETDATAAGVIMENVKTSAANENTSKSNLTVPVAIIAAATMKQINAADLGKLAQTSVQTIYDNTPSRASSKERIGRKSNNPTPMPVATRKSMRAHVTPAKYGPDLQHKPRVQSSEDKTIAASALTATVLHKAAQSVSAVSLPNEPPVPIKLCTNLEALHATRGVKRKGAPTPTGPATTEHTKGKRTRLATPVPSAGVAAIRPVPFNVLQQEQTPAVPDVAAAHTLQPNEYLHKKLQLRVRINRRPFATYCKNLINVSIAGTTTGGESPISLPSTEELLPSSTTATFANDSNASRQLPMTLPAIHSEVPQIVPSTFIPIEPKTEIVDEPATSAALPLAVALAPTLPSAAAATSSEHSTALDTTTVAAANSLKEADTTSRRHQDTSVAATDVNATAVGATQACNEEHIIGGTRIYSYLHPIKYNRSYEKVQLDYCCPNLKGPMIAIDPTRLYHETQAPVREIPAAIVMTTKVVKSSEYQKNRELLPEPVRLKIERRNGGFSVASFLAAGGGVLHKRLEQSAGAQTETMTASSVTNPLQQSEMPVSASTMAQLKKRLPASHPTATKESSMATQKRLELQRNVQLFDELLQQVTKRVSTISTQSRQRVVSAIVANSSLEAADFQLGVKLLKNYSAWLDNVALTSTTTDTQQQQDAMQPPANARPIYDEHKNVIGYQCIASPKTIRKRNTNEVATISTTPATTATDSSTTSAQLSQVPQCSFYAYSQMSNTPTTKATIGAASLQLCLTNTNADPKNVLVASTSTSTTASDSVSDLRSYKDTTCASIVDNEPSELMNVTIAADNFNEDIIMRDLNSTASSISSSGAGAEECILPDAVMVAKEIKSERLDDEVLD